MPQAPFQPSHPFPGDAASRWPCDSNALPLKHKMESRSRSLCELEPGKGKCWGQRQKLGGGKGEQETVPTSCKPLILVGCGVLARPQCHLSLQRWWLSVLAETPHGQIGFEARESVPCPHEEGHCLGGCVGAGSAQRALCY